MSEQKPIARFSWARFAMFALVPGLAVTLGDNEIDTPRKLFLAGIVVLAFFAGVINPLSATSSSFKPASALQWVALWAAIAGSVLILFSLFLRLG